MKVIVEGIEMNEVVLMASLKVLYEREFKRTPTRLYEREFKRTPTREELVRFTQAFIAASPEVRVEK
jgi:hypothetical protein